MNDAHVVVSAHQDKERAAGGGHMKQPRVRKHVVPQLTRPILPPQLIRRCLRVPIKHTEVKVAAGVVLGPIGMVGVEDTMNDQIREREEQTRDTTRVFLKLLPQKKGVEHEPRVRQRGLG